MSRRSFLKIPFFDPRIYEITIIPLKIFTWVKNRKAPEGTECEGGTYEENRQGRYPVISVQNAAIRGDIATVDDITEQC